MAPKVILAKVTGGQEIVVESESQHGLSPTILCLKTKQVVE